MSSPATVTYLRAGLTKRGTGTIVATGTHGRVKVKPTRADWGHIWITQAEIAAGAEKPPVKPQEKKEDAQPPVKRERKPKAQPLPKWKQLVDEAAICAEDPYLPLHTSMLLRELAAELEAAQSLFKSQL